MISSIKYLLQSPYNKQHLGFAMYRFFLWKFIRAFKVKDYQLSIWNDKKVSIHYDSVQSMWLMYNYWVDWEEFHLIKDVVLPDDTVFDIGSNIGLYTLWISKYIKSGKIHSFEPDTKNHSRFEKNVLLNGVQHVVVINKIGVSNNTGTIYLTQDRDVQNHVVFEKTQNSVEIKTITLDEYCSKNGVGRIRYLKIDIEGFEMLAFKGAESLLREGRIDIIQLEINNALANSGVTEQELIAYLKSFGYYLARYDIGTKKLERIEFTPERENYFAVRETLSIK